MILSTLPAIPASLLAVPISVLVLQLLTIWSAEKEDKEVFPHGAATLCSYIQHQHQLDVHKQP